MRRITKAALSGIAGCALVLGATQVASGEVGTTYTFAGRLRDLQTTDGVFDSAKAVVKITETTGGSSYWIRVKGIGPVAPGDEFHSHLHTGPCIEGDGLAAGPHYNSEIAAGIPKELADVSAQTEVWFELAPNEDGVAVYQTSVSFVPKDFNEDQVMSIVIHSLSSSLREACLPLDFSEDDQ